MALKENNETAYRQGQTMRRINASQQGSGEGQDQVFGGMFNLKGIMDAFYQLQTRDQMMKQELQLKIHLQAI